MDKKQKKEWRDHVEKLTDNRIPKIIKNRRPNTSRLLGVMNVGHLSFKNEESYNAVNNKTRC